MQIKKNEKLSSLIPRYGVFIAFVLLCVLFAAFSPAFLTGKNMINLVRQVAFNAILSMGMTLVMISGGIDLSVGSVMALAAVITASLVKLEGQIMPVFPAVVIGLLVGAVCGGINGVTVSKGKLAPFIASLVMMTAARGFAQLYTKGHPVSVLTEAMTKLGTSSVLGIPVPVLALILVVIITYLILNWTKLGRYIYAVGGNELAAEASGIQINRVKIFAYVYSGILAAMVGILLAARLDSASPALGTGYETDAIAAAAIGGASMNGGRGKVLPVLCGAMIIGTISNGLDIINVSSYWQQIIKAIIILAAVLMDRSSRN